MKHYEQILAKYPICTSQYWVELSTLTEPPIDGTKICPDTPIKIRVVLYTSGVSFSVSPLYSKIIMIPKIPGCYSESIEAYTREGVFTINFDITIGEKHITDYITLESFSYFDVIDVLLDWYRSNPTREIVTLEDVIYMRSKYLNYTFRDKRIEQLEEAYCEIEDFKSRYDLFMLTSSDPTKYDGIVIGHFSGVLPWLNYMIYRIDNAMRYIKRRNKRETMYRKDAEIRRLRNEYMAENHFIPDEPYGSDSMSSSWLSNCDDYGVGLQKWENSGRIAIHAIKLG